jgi:hypothetical protein
MGRLRKDKVPTALSPIRPRTEPKLRAAKSQKRSLKEQVIQLGGNEDDYNLVKDFGDHHAEEGPSPDVRLYIVLYCSRKGFHVL